MSDYIYDQEGRAHGFRLGDYIYDMGGTAIGRVSAERAYRLDGTYVGELHKSMVVEKPVGVRGNLPAVPQPAKVEPRATAFRSARPTPPYLDVFRRLSETR